MTDLVWRSLRAPEAADVILAVDFGDSRAERGFRDLSTLIDPKIGVLEIISVRDSPAEVDSAHHLDRVVDAVLGDGVRVRAVLSYCAGVSLAAGLVDRLVRASGYAEEPPALIAFDPHPSTPEVLSYQFLQAVDGIADHLADHEVAAAHRLVSPDVLGRVDMIKHAEFLIAAHGPLVATALRRLGIDEGFSADIARRFGQFLSYLVMCSQPAYAEWTAVADVVLSQDAVAPVFPVGQAVMVACSRDLLLGDRRAADVVDRLVGGSTGAVG